MIDVLSDEQVAELLAHATAQYESYIKVAAEVHALQEMEEAASPVSHSQDWDRPLGLVLG